MTFTSTDYDQQILDDARKLGALDTISQIAEYFTAQGRDDGARNPLPSFFGRGTYVIRDLLAIIDRQAAEIATLRKVTEGMADRYLADDTDDEPLTHVPMACTECGKPVSEIVTDTGLHGEWMHDLVSDARDCPRSDDQPVKARVDA